MSKKDEQVLDTLVVDIPPRASQQDYYEVNPKGLIVATDKGHDQDHIQDHIQDHDHSCAGSAQSRPLISGLEEAAQMLASGGTVIFPTETVYGLGANAYDPQATAKIYAAKGRPSDNPLIVHIAHEAALIDLIADLPRTAVPLMKAFWPGPLTLIFKKSDGVPLTTTGGLATVAVRMPNHPLALALIERAGVPVAAPSANLSGKPSPTQASHVIADMKGRVDAILTQGDADLGLESTVLDISGKVPVLLRPGTVTIEQIEGVVGPIQVDGTLLIAHNESDLVPKAPGMKYRHYAPEAAVYVVNGDQEALAHFKGQFEAQGQATRVIDEADAHLLGKNLFHMLRQADLDGVKVVLVRAVPATGVGLAVMNRLLKAAGHKQLQL